MKRARKRTPPAPPAIAADQADHSDQQAAKPHPDVISFVKADFGPQDASRAPVDGFERPGRPQAQEGPFRNDSNRVLASTETAVCANCARLAEALAEARAELLRVWAEREKVAAATEARVSGQIAAAIDRLTQAVGGVNSVHNVHMGALRNLMIEYAEAARAQRATPIAPAEPASAPATDRARIAPAQ